MKKKESGKVSLYAGSSSAAVAKATGKSWAEWFRILDRAGAKKMTHKDIAKWLHTEFASDGLSGWWCQQVTVGYEQARGLRVVGQNAGGFSANASKTISAPIKDVYNAFIDNTNRAKWLGAVKLEITAATQSKSLRAVWNMPASRISVNFYSKGARKGMVQLEHMKLADAKTRESMKAFWKTKLAKLAALLEHP